MPPEREKPSSYSHLRPSSISLFTFSYISLPSSLKELESIFERYNLAWLSVQGLFVLGEAREDRAYNASISEYIGDSFSMNLASTEAKTGKINNMHDNSAKKSFMSLFYSML